MKRTLVILAFLLTTAFAEFASWPSQVTPLEQWEISYNGLNQSIVWFARNQDGATGIFKRSVADAVRQRVTLKYDQKQDFAFIYIGPRDDQWICAFRNDNKAPKLDGTLYHIVGNAEAQEVASGCKLSLAFLAGGSQDLNWPPVVGDLQLWDLKIGDEAHVVEATGKALDSSFDGAFNGIAVAVTDPKIISRASLFRYDTGSEILFAIRIYRFDGSVVLCSFQEARKRRNSIGGGDTLYGDLAVASTTAAEFQRVEDKQCRAQMVSL